MYVNFNFFYHLLVLWSIISVLTLARHLSFFLFMIKICFHQKHDFLVFTSNNIINATDEKLKLILVHTQPIHPIELSHTWQKKLLLFGISTFQDQFANLWMYVKMRLQCIDRSTGLIIIVPIHFVAKAPPVFSC